MLNLISGNLQPDAGGSCFDGHDITPTPAASALPARHRPHLPDPSAVRGLTVFENVLVGATFGGAPSGGRDGDRRPSVAPSSAAGLLDRANVRAGSLTLLDRKRLELARALATGPGCCCSTRSPAG